MCRWRAASAPAGEPGGSSAVMAGCRVSRGRAGPAAPATGGPPAAPVPLPPDRDVRHVPVEAVALEPDESLRDEDRFESCEVLRATSHDAARRGGGGGRPYARHESERDDENSTEEETEPARAGAVAGVRGAGCGAGVERRPQARSQRSRRSRPAGARSLSGRSRPPVALLGGSRRRQAHAAPCCPRDERSAKLLVLAGVCLLLKLEECLQRPIPRVTRDSSMALHTSAQSFLNCFVRIAYRNGLQHELSGSTNTVNTFASSSDTSCAPKAAVNAKNAMGDQHRKSVNTSRAMRFAIRESLEFHACEPRMAQYIFR